jgi:hypothetical protein
MMPSDCSVLVNDLVLDLAKEAPRELYHLAATCQTVLECFSNDAGKIFQQFIPEPRVKEQSPDIALAKVHGHLRTLGEHNSDNAVVARLASQRVYFFKIRHFLCGVVDSLATEFWS